MNKRKREIRKFLVGAYMEGQDGLEACSGLFNPFFAGSRRGALSAYLFGVTTVRYVIEYRGKADKIISAFGKALADVGRHAKLASAPDALFTVVLPLIRTPYAFTFETDGGGDGVLIYYSARGLFTQIKGRIQLKRLLNTIDDSLPISVEKKQPRRRKDKASQKEETKKQKTNDDAASGKQ